LKAQKEIILKFISEFGDLNKEIIKEKFSLPFPKNRSYKINQGYNGSYSHNIVEGEYLPFMPPVRILSVLNQEIKTRSGFLTSMNLKCAADFNAAQNHYLALDKTETPTRAYTLVNVGMLTTIHYSQNHVLQFQVQVNNLFYTVYQSNQSRLKYFEYYSSSPSGYLGIYGMGRNICAKLIFPI
jgi:iron complex outermembrane recepter protein